MPELLISSQWKKKKKYDAHTLCQIQLWLLFDVFPVLSKKDDLQIQRKGFFFPLRAIVDDRDPIKTKALEANLSKKNTRKFTDKKSFRYSHDYTWTTVDKSWSCEQWSQVSLTQCSDCSHSLLTQKASGSWETPYFRRYCCHISIDDSIDHLLTTL